MNRQDKQLHKEFNASCAEVSRKLGLQNELCQKIFTRVGTVGKGDSTLAHLHEIMALCQSLFEKVNTEAARLGVTRRKL